MLTPTDRPRNPRLLEPARLGPLDLSNRILMAPMTRNRAGADGVPTAMMVEYYRQRAAAGLTVSEATQVSRQGVGYPNTPGIHDDTQVDAWRPVVDAVHQEGGRIFLQLFHAGRISHPSLQPGAERPVAPSALRPSGEVFTPEGPQPFETPRALERHEIEEVVEEFRRGARLAGRAGFDGVEIHGANGYLPDQFLRDATNRRGDEYGGDARGRARFLVEVCGAAADELGPERVGVRISPLNPFNDISDGDPPATFGTAARLLGELGLAYLHVVETGGEEEERASFDFRELKERFGGPYVANGDYDLPRAERVLEEGRADFVSFGRLYLANPDLPARFARGAELNEPDPETFYGGGEEGYLDYPALKTETGG